MVARLLGQLQEGAGGRQSQPGHVGFTEEEAENNLMHQESHFDCVGHNNNAAASRQHGHLPHSALLSQVSVAVQNGRQHPQGGVSRFTLVVLHSQ